MTPTEPHPPLKQVTVLVFQSFTQNPCMAVIIFIISKQYSGINCSNTNQYYDD